MFIFWVSLICEYFLFVYNLIYLFLFFNICAWDINEMDYKNIMVSKWTFFVSAAIATQILIFWDIFEGFC